MRHDILFAPSHQNAALPLHKMTVLVFGLLALTSTAGGIVAIVWNATAKTEFSMFGVTLTTGHVGVALVGMGLVTTVFTIRSVLKNQHDLAVIPYSEMPVVQNTSVDEFVTAACTPTVQDLNALRAAVAARTHLDVYDREFALLLRVGSNYHVAYPFNWEPFRDVAGPWRLTATSLPVVLISRDSGVSLPETARLELPTPHFEVTISPECALIDIANTWLELLSANHLESAVPELSCNWFPANLSLPPESLTSKSRRFLNITDVHRIAVID